MPPPAVRRTGFTCPPILFSNARGEARAIVERDPELAKHPELRDAIATRYEERARLFRVG